MNANVPPSGPDPPAEYAGAPPYAASKDPALENAPSAFTALITGIVGLGVCWPVGIAGIVFGNRAKQEIERSGGAYGGDGMATAGIVLGWIAVALLAIFGVFVIGFILWLGFARAATAT